MFEEFKNAFQRHNNAHVQLIIINVVVFLVLVVFRVVLNVSQLPEIFEVIHQQVAIPAPLLAFLEKPWTIITYAFVHDLTGIATFFNMLFFLVGKLFVEYLGATNYCRLFSWGIAGRLHT